jgi:hypothetical protein
MRARRWFVKLPGETYACDVRFYEPVPEEEARQYVRNQLGVKRLPNSTRVWPDQVFGRSRKMRHGYRYQLKDKRDQFGQPTRYHYVEPVEYADGSVIGDCWIVDRRGNKHPGYNVSPVPFHVDQLGKGRRIA